MCLLCFLFVCLFVYVRVLVVLVLFLLIVNVFVFWCYFLFAGFVLFVWYACVCFFWLGFVGLFWVLFVFVPLSLFCCDYVLIISWFLIFCVCFVRVSLFVYVRDLCVILLSWVVEFVLVFGSIVLLCVFVLFVWYVCACFFCLGFGWFVVVLPLHVCFFVACLFARFCSIVLRLCLLIR